MNKKPPINIIQLIYSLFTKHTNKTEEIKDLIENREKPEKPLSVQEKELITAVLNFEQLDAGDIGVPRSDIIYLNIKNTFEEIVQAFKISNHSRLPVCGKNLDDIVGFVNIKDILSFISKENKKFNIEKLMRPCRFVPDSMNINKVLQQMKSSKVQMAIVLDEYGGTAGLVTLKDILEELVGDLEDEHEEANSMLTIKSKGIYNLDPRMEIEDLEQHLNTEFKIDTTSDYDTIGGLILQIAGKVPLKDEIFNINNSYKVKIVEADGRRIKSLELISVST